jgi:D-arabinan endo alpha-(1,5)-arabinofuranosidase
MRVTRVDDLGMLTGAASANRTGSGFGVYGTDLGILWDDGNGEILVAFGDTYGAGWGGHGSGPDDADWRFNVLAGSITTDLAGGMALYPVVTRPDGTAGEFLDRDPTVEREATVIPTSGIAAGGVNYVHYMSVRQWGPPGHWHTNHGGIAVSHDFGRTWSRPASARWPNRRAGLFGRREQSFQLGAFARQGTDVYLMGTPNGRFGAGSLARVDEHHVSDIDRYQYWTGRNWVTGDPFATTPVLSAPVSELSLQHNTFHDRWLAMYLDEHRAAIVLRSAPELTGPWDRATVVVAGADYPGLYGGFLHPWATDGPDVYFTLSQWGPYNVRLMRATLGGMIA